jgi:hypothetical protein
MASGVDEPDKEPVRIPGTPKGYDDEVEALIELPASEILSRWVSVQKLLGPESRWSRNFEESMDDLLSTQEEFAIELLEAFLNSEDSAARAFALVMIEPLPYLGHELLAWTHYEKLAGDKSPLVLEALAVKLHVYINANPEEYKFKYLTGLIPILQDVIGQLGRSVHEILSTQRAVAMQLADDARRSSRGGDSQSSGG